MTEVLGWKRPAQPEPVAYDVVARDKGGTTTYYGRVAHSPEEAIAIVRRTLPSQSWWPGAKWTAAIVTGP